MSEPLRFKPVNPAHEMIYSPDGGWVSWEDYARLKADVERLTKAGDAFVLLLEDEGYSMESIREVDGWNAAKENPPHA
jgi:hypothetical protein